MNVTEVLEQGPDKIQKAESTLANKRQALDKAKLALEVARATALISNKDAKNQKVLEALVTQDKAVQESEAAVIKALGEVKEAEIAFHMWENAFASARKLANLQMTMNEIATPSA